MALWKPFRGNRIALDTVEKHDGYVYFCTDDGTLFFDYVDSDDNLQRKQISAKDAETLTGLTLDEIKEYVSVQSDWAQNNESATDYIKNRTHYEEETIEDVEYVININGEHDIPLELGQTYELWYTTSYNSEWTALTNASTSEIITCEVQEDTNGLYVGDPNHSVWPTCVRQTNSTVMSQFISAYSILSMKIITHATVTVVHQIDQKYIPDIIARVSDIHTQIQSDWNVNDESDVDYIKNRPFGDFLVEKEYIFERGDTTKVGGTNAYEITCSDFDGNNLVIGEGYSVYYTTSLAGDATVWTKMTPATGEKFIAQVDENGVVYIGNPAVSYDATFYISAEICAVNYMWVNQSTYAKGIKLVGPFTEIKHIDPKFIKDMYYKEELEIVPQTTFNLTEDNLWNESIVIPDLICGDTYVVIWDGIEYKCVAISDNQGGDVLGNFALVDEPFNTNEPFFIYEVDNGALFGICAQSAGEHTVSITHVVHHKIDEVYLPDTIARVEDISEQVQSDWSVNDEANPAYVKNRTHWEESAEGAFTNEALSFSYIDVLGLYQSDGIILDGNAYAPTVGSTVTFEFNGTSYDLTVFEDTDGYIAYGDTEADLLAGTGAYGFRVINWWVNRYNIQSLIEITTASVVLHYNYSTYHALDREKYLPTVPGYLDGTSIRFGSNTSTGNSSIAEGFGTKATGDFSHAAGMYTEASASRAFAIGDNTHAASYDQFVHGRYNVEDADGVYAHIVGNGTQLNGDSNAYTLDWSGNAWFAGDIKVGGTGQDDAEAKTLATQDYVQSFLPKTTTVTILAANWTGEVNPWSQVVTVNGVTENSKVDLQPTALQIVSLQNDEISLMLQNDAGVVTAWAIGNKPTEDYTMQVLITEVVML